MRALVLAGGGMRGAYTTGALHTMAEMGLSFDGVYGTSSGGANAAWFVAGQTAESVKSWTYAQDPRIVNYRRFLLRSGPLLDLDALLFHVYPNELGFDAKKVATSRTRVEVTATDVDTGRVRFLDLGRVPVLKALRATSALPFATTGPVAMNGRRYLDGGLTCPVPLARAMHDGATDITVILSRPAGPRRTEPAALAWYFTRLYPALGVAARSHQVMIDDSAALALGPPHGVTVRVLRPSRPNGLHRMSRDATLIEAGIRQGEAEARAFFAAS